MFRTSGESFWGDRHFISQTPVLPTCLPSVPIIYAISFQSEGPRPDTGKRQGVVGDRYPQSVARGCLLEKGTAPRTPSDGQEMAEQRGRKKACGRPDLLFQGPNTGGRIQAWNIAFSVMETESGHWQGSERESDCVRREGHGPPQGGVWALA